MGGSDILISPWFPSFRFFQLRQGKERQYGPFRSSLLSEKQQSQRMGREKGLRAATPAALPVQGTERSVPARETAVLALRRNCYHVTEARYIASYCENWKEV